MGSSENKQAAATFSFQIRTDLALEDKESFEGDGVRSQGCIKGKNQKRRCGQNDRSEDTECSGSQSDGKAGRNVSNAGSR